MFPNPPVAGVEGAAASHVRASLDHARARNTGWTRRRRDSLAEADGGGGSGDEEEARAAEEAMRACGASCAPAAAAAALRALGGRASSADDATSSSPPTDDGWRRLTRVERAEIVERARKEGEDAMLRRLQHRMERAGVVVEGLRVTYDRLTVTRRARAAGEGLPSVVSPLRDAAAALLPRRRRGGNVGASSSSSSSSAPPTTVDALCDVSGVLRPATTTLLLGAPGAGKTTLLRALSGRLLRPTGAIVHVGLKKGRGGAGADDDGGDNNCPSPPHYWLRYNGAPAAPPSPLQPSAASPAATLAARLAKACGCAPSSSSAGRPSFDVPAVATYVDQAELGLPALTVRETLEFAERCQGADAPSLDAVRQMLAWEEQNKELVAAEGPPTAADAALDALLRAVAGLPQQSPAAGESSAGGKSTTTPITTVDPRRQERRQERLIAEWTLRSLRLEHAADTPVGDAMLRGVSGGERRRVALGEALVGPAFFMALDEVTTGLDSASALEVARALRRSARTFRVTVLCALLQPEPAVVEAFDDLVLLARGRVLYHGPVAGALPHFASLGLRPRLGQDAAEFLVGIAADDDAEAARLSALFWGGEAGRALRREAAAAAVAGDDGKGQGGVDAEQGQGRGAATAATAPLMLPKRPHAPLSQVVRATFRRTYTLEVARNWEAYAVRAGLALLMMAVMGTLFLRLPTTALGGAAIFGALVSTLDFFAVLSIPTAQTTLLQMPLLLKQRDARYHPAWALLLPQQLVAMAALAMDVACYALPLYFLVGLAPSAGPFFRYALVCYCFALCLDAMYRAFGALSPSVAVAVSGMTVLFLLFNALAGLTIAARSIPVWWRWFYWINPFSWGLRALAVNELTQPRWQQGAVASGAGEAAATTMTLGDGLLELYDMPRGAGSVAWVWAGAGVLAGEALIFLALAWWGYASRRAPVPPVDVVVGAGGSKGNTTKAAAIEAGAPPVAAAAGKPPPPTVLLPLSAASAAPPALNGNGGDDDGGKASSSSLTLAPVSVAFRDLCYYVRHPNPSTAADKQAPAPPPSGPLELQLLRDVTGHFRPGRVAALMGASGAGKTTLLDVLALRKTSGRITGDVTVGGGVGDPRRHPARFRAVSGYCEQSSDLHVGLATVRESVVFSAALRLRDAAVGGSTSATAKHQQHQQQQRRGRVEAAADAALAVVGLAPQSGVLVQALSSEQKKRLTIAVELAGRPSVLFLDEPTSGLDSGGAWAVARALRAVAARGGTVVCTVHQPGDALFRHAFDDLLLLRRGGAVVYFGPLSPPAAAAAAAASDPTAASCSVLAAYFEGVEARLAGTGGGGAPEEWCIPPLLPGQNPAAWVVGVVGAASRTADGPDLARAWRESDEARAARETAGALLGEAEDEAAAAVAAAGATTAPPAPRAFAVSSYAQWRALTARNLRAHWRHPARNLTRVLYAVVAAALIGTIYFGRGSLQRRSAAIAAAGSQAPSSPGAATVQTKDVLNAAGCFFLVVVALCMESAYAAQEGLAAERPAMYRERAAGLYSPLPYLLAQTSAELPWCLAAVLLFVGVAYGLLGCLATPAAFFYFVAVGFLGVVAVFAVAQLLVHASPALFVATLALSVAATAQQALAGLYRARPTSPPWFAWAYWVNPLWYTFAGLVGSQLGGEEGLRVSDAALVLGGGGPEAPPPPTVAAFVDAYFGVADGGLTSPGACLGMLGVLCLGATTLSYVALRTLNFQNR